MLFVEPKRTNIYFLDVCLDFFENFDAHSPSTINFYQRKAIIQITERNANGLNIIFINLCQKEIKGYDFYLHLIEDIEIVCHHVTSGHML